MFFDIFFWLTIGFLPTYGAMELAWRIARRRVANENKISVMEEEATVTSVDQTLLTNIKLKSRGSS